MKYEISNNISNRKYLKEDISFRHPFSNNKNKDGFFLIEDKPINLFTAYEQGFCMKPHAFTMNNLNNTKVNSIVLDFDDLTEIEYDFVKSICQGKFRFNDIYGSDSAGMKTTIHHNAGIPNFKPSKFKFKVFYPVNCLATKNDIYNAYLEAVGFFNPIFPMDEVKKTWDKWIKANNRKDKVCDECFNGWILPDVAYMNSYRTQITYGCDVNQTETFKKLDDIEIMGKMKGIDISFSKFPSTSKWDYEGLEWKPCETSIKSKKITTPPSVTGQLANKLKLVIGKGETIGALHYPCNRSSFAKQVGEVKFSDLILDESIDYWIWGKKGIKYIETNWRKSLFDSNLERIVYAEVRNAKVYSDFKGSEVDWDEVFNDIIHILKNKCGANIINQLTKAKLKNKKGKTQLDMFVDKVIRCCLISAHHIQDWKLNKKIEHIEQSGVKVPWDVEAKNEHLRAYVDNLKTNPKFANQELGEYMKCLKEIKEKQIEFLKNYKVPYVWTKKNLKSDVLNRASAWGKMSIYEEFKSFVEDQNERILHTNLPSDETLMKWYEEYRANWNNEHKGDVIERKEHKQHKSKYSDLFINKSKNEIEELINKMDISKGQRSKLKARYLK